MGDLGLDGDLECLAAANVALLHRLQDLQEKLALSESLLSMSTERATKVEALLLREREARGFAESSRDKIAAVTFRDVGALKSKVLQLEEAMAKSEIESSQLVAERDLLMQEREGVEAESRLLVERLDDVEVEAEHLAHENEELLAALKAVRRSRDSYCNHCSNLMKEKTWLLEQMGLMKEMVCCLATPEGRRKARSLYQPQGANEPLTPQSLYQTLCSPKSSKPAKAAHQWTAVYPVPTMTEEKSEPAVSSSYTDLGEISTQPWMEEGVFEGGKKNRDKGSAQKQGIDWLPHRDAMTPLEGHDDKECLDDWGRSDVVRTRSVFEEECAATRRALDMGDFIPGSPVDGGSVRGSLEWEEIAKARGSPVASNEVVTPIADTKGILMQSQHETRRGDVANVKLPPAAWLRGDFERGGSTRSDRTQQKGHPPVHGGATTAANAQRSPLPALPAGPNAREQVETGKTDALPRRGLEFVFGASSEFLTNSAAKVPQTVGTAASTPSTVAAPIIVKPALAMKTTLSTRSPVSAPSGTTSCPTLTGSGMISTTGGPTSGGRFQESVGTSSTGIGSQLGTKGADPAQLHKSTPVAKRRGPPVNMDTPGKAVNAKKSLGKDCGDYASLRKSASNTPQKVIGCGGSVSASLRSSKRAWK